MKKILLFCLVLFALQACKKSEITDEFRIQNLMLGAEGEYNGLYYRDYQYNSASFTQEIIDTLYCTAKLTADTANQRITVDYIRFKGYTSSNGEITFDFEEEIEGDLHFVHYDGEPGYFSSSNKAIYNPDLRKLELTIEHSTGGFDFSSDTNDRIVVYDN